LPWSKNQVGVEVLDGAGGVSQIAAEKPAQEMRLRRTLPFEMGDEEEIEGRSGLLGPTCFEQEARLAELCLAAEASLKAACAASQSPLKRAASARAR